MVLDEVDSAQEKLKGPAKSKTTERAASTGSSTAESGLLEQSKEWWKQARSLEPATKDTGIVSCRLREGTQFMSKDDCLIRGGIPRTSR